MATRTKTNTKTGKARQPGRAGRVAFAVLVAAAVLALAFFLVLRTQNQTSIAENALGTIFSPLERAFSGVTIFVRDTVNGAKDYFRMAENLQSAQQEVSDLKLQLMEYKEAADENERLRALLGVKERYEHMDPLHARVIARNPGVYSNTFSINKGSVDGVPINAAVITADGLVGHVYEVGLTYSKVRALIDQNSSVACLIERKRFNGTMRGLASLDTDTIECRMYYLPAVSDVAPGDVVITSGADSFYPKGITVGTVTEVTRQQSDVADRSILVEPAVDFLRVEDVLVLRTPVETDTDERLAPLPTPTPRPTPIATPTPSPTPDAGAADSGLDSVWQYPTGTIGEDGELIENATSPPVSVSGEGGTLIEDVWAQ